MRRSSSFFGVACLVLAVACADEKPRPPPGIEPTTPQGDQTSGGGASKGGADGGADGGGGTDAAAQVGPCNDVVVSTVLVDQTNVSGSPPAATGGAIADGIYDLVSANVYIGSAGAGPTGVQLRETLEITGGTLERLLLGGGQEIRETYTFSTNASSLSALPTCPSSGPAKLWQYSVVGSQLTLWSTPAVGQTVENVYTRK